MAKNKKPFFGRLKYLRELSVVIVGIAVTFMVSGWIADRKEKKDLNRYLNSVKAELASNLGMVKYDLGFYEQNGRLSKYLSSDKAENLSADSILAYNLYDDELVMNRIITMKYKSNAFEVLKISGLMKLIRDEALSEALVETYDMLENVRAKNDSYMQKKMDIIYETIMQNYAITLDMLAPCNKRLFYFFAVHMTLENLLEDCAEQIQKTIALLDTALGRKTSSESTE